VISFVNRYKFWPRKRYDFVIDSRWNLGRLAPLQGPDCVKILHVDVAHLLFQNAAEYNRLLALQWRKGVTLMPRRVSRLSQGIEVADCATVLGNEFTMNTYRHANKPMYPIPLSQSVLYEWSEGKTSKTAVGAISGLEAAAWLAKGSISSWTCSPGCLSTA
jgi:hypothetical protein